MSVVSVETLAVFALCVALQKRSVNVRTLATDAIVHTVNVTRKGDGQTSSRLVPRHPGGFSLEEVRCMTKTQRLLEMLCAHACYGRTTKALLIAQYLRANEGMVLCATLVARTGYRRHSC